VGNERCKRGYNVYAARLDDEGRENRLDGGSIGGPHPAETREQEYEGPVEKKGNEGCNGAGAVPSATALSKLS